MDQLLKIIGFVVVFSAGIFVSSVFLYFGYVIAEFSIKKLWAEKEIVVGIVQARSKSNRVNTEFPIKMPDGNLYEVKKVEK